MTDHLPSESPTVERLTRYTMTEQSEILGDSTDPFGVADTGLVWLPKEDHFGVRMAGRLVAHTGLLRLPIAIGRVRTDVVGVGGVAVSPDLRGNGLARLAMTAALQHARTMGPQHGLLFCRPPLVPLYQRLGWRTLDQDVQVQQHEGPVTMPLRTMWTPLHHGVHWPTGTVRLLSLPM
ncbi:GNAT family N-acetyltransferase [Streptomyces sp. NPDC050997]|uniref:GNAT family N-acetyltransferase n=1 Tax=Streptomyces sp. NPDC050997 TaxID=3155519 RepID=UPI003412F815